MARDKNSQKPPDSGASKAEVGPDPTAEQIQLKKSFEFHVRDVYRWIFRRAFFKGKSEQEAWEVVATRLKKDPRTLRRWQRQEKSRHTKLPDKPDVDTLLLYTIADNKGMFTIPAGSVVANRAIATTLMAIRKSLPYSQGEEITEERVAYLRFYVQNMKELKKSTISPVILERMQNELEFKDSIGQSPESIIEEMRTIYRTWCEEWRLLTSAVAEYDWLYKNP
jgi:hypothetical protein